MKFFNYKIALLVGVLSFSLFSCSTNPVTGRKQLILVGDSQINGMALQQYNKVMNESKVVKGGQATELKNIGHKIKNSAFEYYKALGKPEVMNGYQWEFNLIQSNQLNAWCMPGGKVAFYTGIMPVCQNNDGIATVMGHEVSHALARHSAERLSKGYIQQFGMIAGNVAIKGEETRRLFNILYPVGSMVGTLAYNRKQETEADIMGLYFMSKAGYDPRETIKFWERMEAKKRASGKNQPPQFLSTHPSSETRIKTLNAHMDKALSYYQKR